MASQNYTCKNCGKLYTEIWHEWCKPCQIDLIKANFTSWTSGNEKIDDFVQKKQLKINHYSAIIFEWIPYNRFENLKEISKDSFTTIYSAIWKDGPLYYNYLKKKDLIRKSNIKVTLKCLNNIQNIDEFLNRVANTNYVRIYGISQNPDVKDYIMVLEYAERGGFQCKKCCRIYWIGDGKWCKPCQIDFLKTNFTSGNETIDHYIQEMQLKFYKYHGIVFEWIQYNQFNDIKEIDKGSFYTVHSAVWIDGPLYYPRHDEGFIKRRPNQKIALKCYNSQNITEFLNKIKGWDSNIILYGISQNPNTKDYIVVFKIESLKTNFTKHISGNKIIDDFIKEKQYYPYDIAFEWIPYNQFYIKKKIGKGDFTTVYSAIWKNGPLHCIRYGEYKRHPNKNVVLKCFYNSPNISNILLHKIKEWDEDIKIYGVSQNPHTSNFIMILEYVGGKQCKNCGKLCTKYRKQYTNIEYKWCKLCHIDFLKAKFKNWTSGNETIDHFIQEMQLNINHDSDIVFEWIQYNQFNEIKEIGKGGFATVYSAIWENGPLHYDTNKQEWIKEPNKNVALKCLYNSQNITNDFLNEVKAYSIKKLDGIISIYGLSQNPITKDYVMVLQYAKGGNFNSWINKNYKNYFNWNNKVTTLKNIIDGLKAIHQKEMVHRDFHTGNILFSFNHISDNTYISDMGLCKEVNNIDDTNIYGVMPYIAPEVLRGNPYTQAADIYSFGMIMYFIATGRQPFDNIAHDQCLALDICNGVRPELNEPEAPKCYADLMKKCFDSNPENRPNAQEVYNLIESFSTKQFDKAEEYRKANLSFIKIEQLTTHPQAIYTSRLLNTFTKNLPKYDNNNTFHSECFDCIAD